MNKNKKIIAASALLFAAIVIFSISLFGAKRSNAAIVSNGPTNGSSTCGQFANGSIQFGPSSSTVSNATSSSPFTISINGTVVTSTAAATTTANALASALLTAIPSSTLGLTVGTTTDGTFVYINVTSTVWGSFVNFNVNPGQLGITQVISANGYPATQILPVASQRTAFNVTNPNATTTFVCLGNGATCGLKTGVALGQYSQFALTVNNDISANSVNQAVSCLAPTASSTGVTWTQN